MSKCGIATRHLYEAGKCSSGNENKIRSMKYALLVHQSQEYFGQRKAPDIAAGKAYGQALQAAGVFVGGWDRVAAGGDDSFGARRQTEGPRWPVCRNERNSSPDSPSLRYQIWMWRWNGLRDILLAAHAAVEVRPLLGSYFAVGAPKTFMPRRIHQRKNP